MVARVSELSSDAILPKLQTRYIGRTYYYFEAVTSTQDEAARVAASGALEGTVVAAHGQTGARGRFRRPWIATPGATLSLSIVLRPPLSVLPMIIMASSLAVVRAIQQITGLRPVIKWPNDILIDGKKVCGILVETAFAGEQADYTIVGIGVNVNLNTEDYPEIRGQATSLSAALGHPVSRQDLLLALLQEMEELYDAAKEGQPVFQWWQDRLSTLKRHIRVQTDANTVEEGIADGVDETGALHLLKENGATLTLYAGEVTLQE